jgi:hypothetical protein
MNMAVVFIYCDYRDEGIQTFVNIMGSLAKQLLLRARSIPAAVWKIHEGMSKAQRPMNPKTAKEIIELVIQQFDRVYVCFDALDELQPDVRNQMLEFFKTVTGTTLRVFVTGRPNVKAKLTGSLANKAISEIAIVANVEDLQTYLKERFSQDDWPEAMDETLQSLITKKIMEWSQGM